MAPLTTPILDFHYVIRSLTTPTTTPLLVKTSLERSHLFNGYFPVPKLATVERFECNKNQG